MKLSYLLTLCYAAVIFTISATPGAKIPRLPAPDYIMHFIEYTGLGFLLFRSFLDSNIIKSMQGNIMLTVAAGMIYGFYDELHQYFVPGRSASIHDIAADTAGSLAGALSGLLFFTFLLSCLHRSRMRHVPAK